MTPETEKLVLEVLQNVTAALSSSSRIPLSDNQRVSEELNRLREGMRAEGDTPPTPTVESVYGKPLADLKPPKGFRFTGEFRPPSDYPEKFMEDGVVCSYGTDPRLPREGRLPRLILKPAKRLVFDILDERPVQRGERFWFGDEVLICRSGGSREVNQSILSEPRVEE